MTIEMEKSRKAVGRNRVLQKLAVGYIRVSTSGQHNYGISHELQRKGIEAYATHDDFTLIEIFEDVGTGVGPKSLYKRAGLRHAIDIAVREGADLIVWDWDRLSRHAGFERDILKRLPDCDRVVCAKRGNTMKEAARAGAFAHAEAEARALPREEEDAEVGTLPYYGMF